MEDLIFDDSEFGEKEEFATARVAAKESTLSSSKESPKQFTVTENSKKLKEELIPVNKEDFTKPSFDESDFGEPSETWKKKASDLQELIKKNASNKIKQLDEMIKVNKNDPDKILMLEEKKEAILSDALDKQKQAYEKGQFAAEIDKGEVAGRAMSRTFLGVARIAENTLESMGLNDKSQDTVMDYISDNEEAISKKMELLGENQGDFFSRDNIAQNLFELGMPLSKIRSIFGLATAEAGLAGSGAYGKGGTESEALVTAATVYGGSVATNAVVRTIGNVIVGREGRVYKRLMENLNLSQKQEDAIYSNYGKLMGKDPRSLTVNEKITAIALGDSNAKGILYASLSKESATKVHSEFNDYARNIGKDFVSKIDAVDVTTKEGIEELQNLVTDVASLKNQMWEEYDRVIDLHYGDVEVSFKKSPELKDSLVKFIRDTDNPQIMSMLKEDRLGLTELKELKQYYSGWVYTSKHKPDMTKAEKAEFDNAKKTLDVLEDLYRRTLPETMLESYLAANKVTKIIADANKKDLFSRFIKEDTNLAPKHIADIVKEMDAPRAWSSYDSFVRVSGKRSAMSNKIEGTLMQGMLRKNTQNGFVDFVKVYDNIEDLHFRTPQGKALKEAVTLYKDVMKNVTDVDFSIIGTKAGDNAGLTLNPAMSAAYAGHRFFYNAITEFLGATKGARASYVLKKLPETLETKNMPKFYSLIEQRGAIVFSRFVTALNKLASENPESIEIGKTGTQYESSQVIGEVGAKRISKDKTVSPTENLDEAIRIFNPEDTAKSKSDIKRAWTKTGWYFDRVDNRWKMHINNNDARIVLPKGKFRRDGVYSMSEVIDMPNIYKAYPELKDRKVRISSLPEKNALGYYNPSNGEVGINKQYDFGAEHGGKFIKGIKETLVHEIQHSIQGIEGFAKGGNTIGMSHHQYLSLHGEVEARALTKGGANTYTKDIYKKEYKTPQKVGVDKDDIPIIKPLLEDQTNYRGQPVGTSTPPEKLEGGFLKTKFED